MASDSTLLNASICTGLSRVRYVSESQQSAIKGLPDHDSSMCEPKTPSVWKKWLNSICVCVRVCWCVFPCKETTSAYLTATVTLSGHQNLRLTLLWKDKMAKVYWPAFPCDAA